MSSISSWENSKQASIEAEMKKMTVSKHLFNKFWTMLVSKLMNFIDSRTGPRNKLNACVKLD